MTLRPPALCLAALIAAASVVSTRAQDPPAPAPAAAAPTASDTAADAVIELVSSRVAFDEQGTSTSDFLVRVRVLTPAGVQQQGTVTLPFRKDDGATLRVEYVRVRKPDGTVIETPLTQSFDLPAPVTQAAPTYSDVYVRHVNVQALQPGDTLEFAWHVVERSLTPGHFWHVQTLSGGDLQTERTEREVSWPAHVRPIVKSPDLEPAITTADGRTTYRWTATNVAPLGADTTGDTPAFEIQVTSFRDWAEVRTAARTLWDGRADVTPEIRAKAMELTAGAATDEQKARALYKYVATSIRYVAVAVGMGRIQPNPAGTVLTNGFGDCKDKHILLEALLRAVGIESTPVLISPGEELDAGVPSMGAFTHVITRIDLPGADPVWVDTTLEVAPFGFLVFTERDVDALPLPPSGAQAQSGGEGRIAAEGLVKTPAVTGGGNVWRTEVEGSVSAEGRLQARVREVTSGDYEVLMRTIFRSAPVQSRELILKELPMPRRRGGTISDIVVSAPEDTDAPFLVEYRYVLDSFIDWGRGMLWPPSTMEADRLPAASDSGEIDLGLVGQMVAVSRLELPDGVEITVPASVPAALDHGTLRYRYRWTISGRVLETERELATLAARVPEAERDSYGAFVASVREAAYAFNVRRFTPWAWNDRLTYDWYENTSAVTQKALASAAAIGRRGDYQEAIAAIRRVLADEPESDAAWQLLAWAEYSSGGAQRALEILRPRVASAKGPSVIKYYAERLIGMRRTTEAIDVLRQGIRRFPDDREMPLYLGELLAVAGEGHEALVLLRSHGDRQQGSARYHFALGRALLAAGGRADAVASLLRSTELDDDASRLNEVAWALGDAGVGLDEALDLARRSAASFTQRINGHRLSDVRAEELGQLASLAMVWDTVGWIHFKRGERQAAERFLTAAWNLSHDPVIARHLVALYEAGNDREAAARYGLLADAVDPAASRTGAPDPVRVRAVSAMRATLRGELVIDLPRGAGRTRSDEVLLLVGPDGRVRDVRVIGTSPVAASLRTALLTVAIPWHAPDQSLQQVVRRGTVGCSTDGLCSLMLLTGRAATATFE